MKFSNARPSPAIVLAVLALVFAMVGSAVAGTDGLSSKITKSKVKKISKKQANKVLDQRESSLSVAKAQEAEKAKEADNANALGGSPAADYLKTTADTRGRSGFDGSCDPGSATFIDCASLTIELARDSRLLINSETPFGGDGATADANGTCRVVLDGVVVPNTTGHPGIQLGGTSDADNTGFGITAVTDPVPAGAHTLVQQCNQTGGDIDFNDLSLSALAIGTA